MKKDDAIFSPRADGNESAADQPPVGIKERLYSKVKISVKTLDIIIAVLVAALVVAVVLGALKGNGVI